MKREKPLSRRHLLQLLAAMGITGPAAIQIVAQSKTKQVSPQILRSANALVDQDFSDERLQTITAAVQRNLDQFQIVRDLVIDDSVEPAPMFSAKVR
jgi:hypothetical protein